MTRVAPLDQKVLKKNGLQWLAAGDNHDYLSTHFVRVTPPELQQLKAVTNELFKRIVETAEVVAHEGHWKEVGIPFEAAELIRYSIRQEQEAYLVGRFDFAGGLDGLPVQLLELNGDTCSLLPETAIVQQLHWAQEQKDLLDAPFNQLLPGLTSRLEDILGRSSELGSNLLISTMGYEEDWLNSDVIAQAARKAGFKEVQSLALNRVIFSEDEGIFVELGPENFRRYDYWFKFIPWDFIVFEEPELFKLLERIILDGHAVVMNPACSMLYQSKGLMKYLSDRYPDHENLLKTAASAAAFSDGRYVRKPVFGRMGENISFFDGQPAPAYETEGDYGDFPPVFQELANFNEDWEDNRYQPSLFWTGEASALCFRRQDDLIIDDDAEFVGHHIAF